MRRPVASASHSDREPLRAGLLGALALLGTAALAAESPLELDEVVVTGQAFDSPLQSLPRSVSVITEREIARSTASTVTELLRQEANLNLQSFFSSDKFATVDIRGMGATASSNVLVLVDGVRLNSDDLAGPDYSILPLSQIERIEIIRGGSAVRYGNGAVGGVINLITKRPRAGARELTLLVRRGAYDSDDYRLHAVAGAGPAAIGVNASDYDSDGYRHNDFIDQQDGSVDLRFEAFDALEVSLAAAQHDDSYGLPGAISLADFRRSAFARRQTNRPFDRASTEDSRYAVTAALDTEAYGRLEAAVTYRDRDNPFVIGFNPAIPTPDQLSLIETEARTARVIYDYFLDWADRVHTLSIGADWNDTDYFRRENGESNPGNSTRRTGSIRNYGYFIDLNLELLPGLTLNAGYRGDRFSSTQSDRRLTRECDIVFVTELVPIPTPFGIIFVPLEIPVERNCLTAFRLQNRHASDTSNDGYSAGLTWQITPNLTTYLSVDQNFRNPNVDEFLFAVDDLGAQQGRGIDGGLRYAWNDVLELSLAGFYLEIEDEIFFSQDPVTGRAINRNLDNPTQRMGGEIELRVRPSAELSMRGGLGYVRPRIEGLDADIPLVPRLTANLSAEWTPVPWVELALSVTRVGDRADGNDLTNREFPGISGYTLCDARVRFTRGQLEVFAGINNVFGEVYTTLAFSGTVYPMPERNAYAGLRIAFF